MNVLAQAMARALLQRGHVRAVDLFVRDADKFADAARMLHEAGFAIVPSKPGTWSLAKPVSPINENEVRAALSSSAAAALARLQIDAASASTNSDALATEPPPPGHMHAFVSDFQWAGKGRRGALWRSPPGTGLCLSVALRLAGTRDLATFSLACGVAVRQALIDAGVPGVQLKWPNDLVVNGHKLGGLLVQARHEPGEPPLLVIGLGLNVTAVPNALDANALPPIALSDVPGAATVTRDALAAAMIEALWRGATAFDADGFAAFDTAWHAADFLCGREVRVSDDRTCVEGIARGVNARGELLVETGGGVHSINVGEVSVRPVALS